MATNREQDVLDAIDALVDEQMAGGEPIGGYDYGDPDFPSCPHCSRGWHGLAITERIERMRWTGEMDEDYRYAEDDSPVLCPGSEFIGPVATPEQLYWMRLDGDTNRDLGGDLSAAAPYNLPELEFPDRWWRNVQDIPDWVRAFLTLQENQPDRPHLLPGPARGLIQEVLRRNIMRSRPWCEWSINDGDRVAFVDRNGVRFEGIAHIENTVVDEERPWISRTTINLEQVTTVQSEIRGVTVGPAIYDEAIDPMHSARNRIAEFQNQLAAIAADAELAFDARMWLPGDRVPTPAAETPQQRALPRPSTTPPMWANDPARTRRTRNRSRNIRTPRV